MCGGCPEFIKAKASVIESAAKLQYNRLVTDWGDYEDLCQAAYMRILETKERQPGLVDKPDAYLHTIVKNLNVDNWRRERRASRIAEHAELIAHHIQSRLTQNPDRLIDIQRLFEVARTDDERRALLSVANDESLEDYAQEINQPKANASVARMRHISAIASRLQQGG
jgi:DNA-directed RNA polymerase specialized sigma24 family protein